MTKISSLDPRTSTSIDLVHTPPFLPALYPLEKKGVQLKGPWCMLCDDFAKYATARNTNICELVRCVSAWVCKVASTLCTASAYMVIFEQRFGRFDLTHTYI